MIISFKISFLRLIILTQHVFTAKQKPCRIFKKRLIKLQNVTSCSSCSYNFQQIKTYVWPWLDSTFIYCCYHGVFTCKYVSNWTNVSMLTLQATNSFRLQYTFTFKSHAQFSMNNCIGEILFADIKSTLKHGTLQDMDFSLMK